MLGKHAEAAVRSLGGCYVGEAACAHGWGGAEWCDWGTRGLWQRHLSSLSDEPPVGNTLRSPGS